MAANTEPRGGDMRTRIAPTPSGYVHRGNLVNFALIARWAHITNASLLLRIDDADHVRARPEYIDDIFHALAFLDIVPDVGPKSSVALTQWSQTNRRDRYWDAALSLVTSHMAYVCTCSRTQLNASGQCVRACMTEHRRFRANEASIRVPMTTLESTVVWRRDDIPAYHLASVVDDIDYEVTHIIRGEDLRSSTHTQYQLSEKLVASGFVDRPRFGDMVAHHHPLILDQGKKLSKSAGSASAPPQRDDTLRRWVIDQVDGLLTHINFETVRNVGL